MRLFSILTTLLASFSALCSAAEQSVTVYAWLPAASSPQELARITFSRDSPTSPTISNFKPPTVSASKDADPLIRVGLYDASTKDWRGVVTAASSFDSKFQQKLELHLDLDGRPWHISFSAYPKPALPPKNLRQGELQQMVPQVVAEVIMPHPGPIPQLNKPVVLTSEGKVEEKPEEKSFLQKYWWMIAIFLAIQAFSAVTGDEKK